MKYGKYKAAAELMVDGRKRGLSIGEILSGVPEGSRKFLNNLSVSKIFSLYERYPLEFFEDRALWNQLARCSLDRFTALMAIPVLEDIDHSMDKYLSCRSSVKEALRDKDSERVNNILRDTPFYARQDAEIWIDAEVLAISHMANIKGNGPVALSKLTTLRARML